MAYLTFLLILIVLFGGFLALTVREGKRNKRYFAGARRDLDDRVAHATFIVAHVDFAAFVRDTAEESAARAAHDIAHVILVAVRWVERQLTRAVRVLRERRARMRASAGSIADANGAPAQPSEFARAISDFKQELRAQRAETAAEPPSETTDAIEKNSAGVA